MGWHTAQGGADHDENDDGAYAASNVVRDIFKEFGGTETLRKTVQIHFQDCSAYTLRVLPTIYLQAWTALTGFQDVIVEISMKGRCDCHTCVQTAMRIVL